MEKLILLFLGAVLVFGIVIALSLVFAVVTQWAWAGSVAQIFHLPELNFMQAFWLNVLGGMLFKNSSSTSK